LTENLALGTGVVGLEDHARSLTVVQMREQVLEDRYALQQDQDHQHLRDAGDQSTAAELSTARAGASHQTNDNEVSLSVKVEISY
jgi:hypothetical protein